MDLREPRHPALPKGGIKYPIIAMTPATGFPRNETERSHHPPKQSPPHRANAPNSIQSNSMLRVWETVYLCALKETE